MAMIEIGGLSPLGSCRLWGINKYAQESACDCQMVVTDKGFLWIGRTGFSEGGLGVKKVWPIHRDLQYTWP